MFRIALIAASLGLVISSHAAGQVGQFQAVYEDDTAAFQARYTLSLGAQPQSQLALTYTPNARDWRQSEVTLLRFDRQGIAPLGLTQQDWQRVTLNTDDSSEGSGNAGAILVGGIVVVTVGAVVLSRELEDGVEDIVDCVVGSNCANPG